MFLCFFLTKSPGLDMTCHDMTAGFEKIFTFISASARAEISGPSVIHLPPGATLTLECTINRLDAVPAPIFWKYGEIILSQKDRSGMSLVCAFLQHSKITSGLLEIRRMIL